MAEEHPLKPFYSVLVLAFACSTLVALAAVGLQPYQQINRTLDQKKNILNAAGIYREDVPVLEQFDEVVETRVIELATGRFVEDVGVDPELYDQPAAALSDQIGRPLERDVDEAGIRRLETYSLVHLVRQDDTVGQVVLPVRGKGLWSTMYGLIALDSDLNTIENFGFYEHGETPGLGGEVDNPKWKAGWVGKEVFDNGGPPVIRVIKGNVDPNAPGAEHKVDGISGATLTCNGVTNTVDFWLGPNGFGPYLEKLKGGK